jgi:hypothetical protein
MEKIIIRNSEKELLINFDTRFYPSKHIIKSIQDFSDLCWVSVDGSEKNLQVKLKPKTDDVDLDTLGYEFYNYVLAVIKNSGSISEIAKNR